MIDDNINYEYILRYIRSTIRKRDGIFADMEKFAKENEVPISQIETIRLIEILIRLGNIKNVLEVGAAIGYSAICMAWAGATKIDTIEINADAVRVARKNIELAGYNDRITVHEGDAREVLKELDGKYDMIFVDAAKGQYNEFFENCMRMLKVGGILVSDNVLYKGMTATDELVQHRKITIVKRLRTYVDMLCNHPKLETGVLPIGDGVALSIKTED